MDTITGLPAHPLLVHFPLVAIPVAALLIVLYLIKPAWRNMLDYLLIASGVAIGIGVVLAASSGEALEERSDESAALSAHTALGDQLQTIGVIFGIALIILGLAHVLTSTHRIRLDEGVRRPLMTALMIGTLVIASVAVVWDVRTGHSGAKAVWGDEIQANGPTDGPEGDDDASIPALGGTSGVALGTLHHLEVVEHVEFTG